MNSRPFLNKGILFLPALLFFLITPLFAQELSILQNNGASVLFAEPLRPAAEEVIALYPFIKKRLERILLWEVNFTPTIILIRDNHIFQKMAGNNLTVAFAVPDRDLMVIDYTRMKTDPFTIEATMKHELCHLLLHKNIQREDLPTWLDEGIAQWVSGGLADIIMDRHSVLDDAILSNRLIRFKALEKGFPEDGRRLALAYAESKSLIDYIISVYGPDGVLRLLGYLKDGDGINSAISKSFSISFDELEKRWYESLKKRTTFFTFLVNNLYELLFFTAALLVIYGFIRGILKRRSYEDQDDDVSR